MKALVALTLLLSGAPEALRLAEVELLIDQRKFDLAAERAEAHIERSPRDAEAYLLLGRARFYLEQDRPALHAFSKAIELKPDLAEAHFFRGIVSMYSNDNKSATRDLTRATELAPNNPSYWYELGKHSERTGDTARALSALRHSLKIAPQGNRAASAHFAIGTILGGQSKHAAALKAWTTAIRLKPDYVDAHYNIGQHHQLRGDPKVALEHFIKADRIAKTDFDIIEKIVQALYRMERYDEAAPHRERLRNLAPKQKKTAFCIDQFDAPGGRFFVYESVKKKGGLVDLFSFKLVREGKVEKSIDLEYMAVGDELGTPYVLCVETADGRHRTRGSFRDLPEYGALKSAVLNLHGSPVSTKPQPNK